MAENLPPATSAPYIAMTQLQKQMLSINKLANCTIPPLIHMLMLGQPASTCSVVLPAHADAFQAVQQREDPRSVVRLRGWPLQPPRPCPRLALAAIPTSSRLLLLGAAAARPLSLPGLRWLRARLLPASACAAPLSPESWGRAARPVLRPTALTGCGSGPP